jgi:2-oxo-3-hexenedioate decarboxylase
MSNPSPLSHSLLATLLHEARLEGREMRRLTEAHPTLTARDAYLIQAEGIRLREKAGERGVGFKMGLTSEAKRKQMGLHEAIFGVLTNRMQLWANTPYRLAGQIHPKAEPEIAFRLGRDLSGLLTPDQAWECVDQVAPAIEVLDSRYVGFKYFSLPDVIADNASSSQFLIGNGLCKPSHWRELESWNLGFFSLKDSHKALLAEAQGKEISGSPIQSLVDLARLLHEQGRIAPVGSWVLLGAATPATPLHSGEGVELVLTAPGAGYQSVRLHAV